MNSNDLSLLAQCAISAAYQAGHLIASTDASQLAVNKKMSGDSLASQVVTEIDIASQAIILKTLEPSLKRFDLALLSEEQPDDQARLQKDFFWCIDPLDGTLAFTKSTHGYSVSIALVSKTGIPYIGVIYDPVEGTLYHAIKGQGVFKNSKPWKLPTNSPYITFVNDQSFLSDNSDSTQTIQLENIASKLGYNDFKTITQGGAAMNAMWVLENSPACYFKLPKAQPGGGSLWDFAASACIFTEIGAHVSDIHGKPLQLNQADTTFMHQQGVLYCSDSKLAKIKELLGLAS